MSTISVKGRIRDESRNPLVGYKVKVFDEDVGDDQEIGDATTRGDGNYHAVCERDFFDDPDLYIEVFKPNGTFKVYRSKAIDDFEGKEKTINATISHLVLKHGIHTIQGVVTRSDDHSPLIGYRVDIFDREAGEDERIARTYTKEDGFYGANITSSLSENSAFGSEHNVN